MEGSFVVAILGAESTGKTTLAHALASALAAPGAGPARRVAVVDEYLREFCEQRARTPHRDEQRHIADEQTRRIDAAAAANDIVVADTTALMTAVYSDQVFGDGSLYAEAEAVHLRRADATRGITLLMALDLPWQADGLQRDGPQVQAPVDARVRAALMRSGCGFSVVSGAGADRLAAALACVERALGRQALPATASAASAASAEPPAKRWQWHCERCGDADCERHAFLSGGGSDLAGGIINR